jgi:hypothetical protein
MYSPAGADSSPVVSLDAAGPSAAASNRTNHSEPVGAALGRLWTV